MTLFNGRDFTGWQHAGNGIWTIEDGVLVGRSDKNKPGPGYLLTIAEYADFVLRLEFWISKRGNSGIYIREPARTWGTRGDERPAHGNPAGYEVQIDYNDPKNPTGSLYNVQKARQLVGGEERWNRIEIGCRGAQVRVSIGGQLVNEYAPSRTRRGVIGFQIHGQRAHDHVVKFRDIRITVE